MENNEPYTIPKQFEDPSQKVDVVCDQHNHEMIIRRRKRGSIKKLKNIKNQVDEIIE